MTLSNDLILELADLAENLARTAGLQVVEMRSEAVDTSRSKSSPTDPVTAGDHASERIIVEGINAARPDDGILGEEGTDQIGTSGVVWSIDPIDGTVNYLYGIPAYSVSIAARVAADSTNQEPVANPVLAGAVFNPITEEMFVATRGGGSTLNGSPISVSATTELSGSLIGTGFSYKADLRRTQGQVVAELLGLVRDIRRIGSAALDLCNVACGRLDAYYEIGLNPWDFEAGWLIAAEAGAVVDDLHGGPPSSAFTLAANPKLHAELGVALGHLTTP